MMMELCYYYHLGSVVLRDIRGSCVLVRPSKCRKRVRIAAPRAPPPGPNSDPPANVFPDKCVVVPLSVVSSSASTSAASSRSSSTPRTLEALVKYRSKSNNLTTFKYRLVYAYLIASSSYSQLTNRSVIKVIG